MIVEFRRRTLLPLDDVMGCLKEQYPEPDPFKSAPLPGTARHLRAARQPGESFEAGQVRRDNDRRCPPRSLRVAPD